MKKLSCHSDKYLNGCRDSVLDKFVCWVSMCTAACHSLPRTWNMVVPLVVSAVASCASVNKVHSWLQRCFSKSSFLLSRFSQWWQPPQLWVESGAVMGCLNQHLLLSAAVVLVYTCSVIIVHFQTLLFINENCTLSEVLIWASLSRDLSKYRKYKLVTFVLSMRQIPLIIPGVLQKTNLLDGSDSLSL